MTEDTLKKCPVCGNTLLEETCLGWVFGKNPNIFTCYKCNKRFDVYGNLK